MVNRRPRPPAWLWFNLLSLDAPVIALVWQDFLARCYSISLTPTGRSALGLTVWAIYLADRLLDIRRPGSNLESVRHRFYRGHRGFALALLSLVVFADLLVTALWLRPDVIDSGLVLSGAVFAYLFAFAFAGRSGGAKKPLAALLFTAGTFLIAWTTAGHPVSRLLWPAVAFCALCLGNLLTVEPQSLPGAKFCLMLLCACLVSAWSSTWFAAIVVSAAGLIALARWGRRVPGDMRGVLADAVLLTPLLFR